MEVDVEEIESRPIDELALSEPLGDPTLCVERVRTEQGDR